MTIKYAMIIKYLMMCNYLIIANDSMINHLMIVDCLTITNHLMIITFSPNHSIDSYWALTYIPALVCTHFPPVNTRNPE